MVRVVVLGNEKGVHKLRLWGQLGHLPPNNCDAVTVKKMCPFRAYYVAPEMSPMSPVVADYPDPVPTPISRTCINLSDIKFNIQNE